MIFEIQIHLNRFLSPKCTIKYKYNSSTICVLFIGVNLAIHSLDLAFLSGFGLLHSSICVFAMHGVWN